MDGLSLEGTENKPVMVIGATNRPDTLDSALRRAGRFDREISMGVPDEEARLNILKVMAKKMRLEGDFNFEEVAKKTPGYVGADIRSLTKEAAVFAINRIFKDVLKLDSFDRASGTGEKKILQSFFLNAGCVKFQGIRFFSFARFIWMLWICNYTPTHRCPPYRDSQTPPQR